MSLLFLTLYLCCVILVELHFFACVLLAPSQNIQGVHVAILPSVVELWSQLSSYGHLTNHKWISAVRHHITLKLRHLYDRNYIQEQKPSLGANTSKQREVLFIPVMQLTTRVWYCVLSKRFISPVWALGWIYSASTPGCWQCLLDTERERDRESVRQDKSFWSCERHSQSQESRPAAHLNECNLYVPTGIPQTAAPVPVIHFVPWVDVKPMGSDGSSVDLNTGSSLINVVSTTTVQQDQQERYW